MVINLDNTLGEVAMEILVLGASGATGRLVVKRLLGQPSSEKLVVKIIVRCKATLSQVFCRETIADSRLKITEASLLSMTESQLVSHVTGCTAVISCLGHNISLQGIYGQPKRLVTTAVKRLCGAINQSYLLLPSQVPVKFILMNSTGVQNRISGEKISFLQAIIIGLIRILVPPHTDNEAAAAYLQRDIDNKKGNITWVVIRPDSLTDQLQVTDYDLYASPTRSAIFDSGKTSRINVAHFIAHLALNHTLWQRWKGHMPVIYNREL